MGWLLCFDDNVRSGVFSQDTDHGISRDYLSRVQSILSTTNPISFDGHDIGEFDVRKKI